MHLCMPIRGGEARCSRARRLKIIARKRESLFQRSLRRQLPDQVAVHSRSDFGIVKYFWTLRKGATLVILRGFYCTLRPWSGVVMLGVLDGKECFSLLSASLFILYKIERRENSK